MSLTRTNLQRAGSARSNADARVGGLGSYAAALWRELRDTLSMVRPAKQRVPHREKNLLKVPTVPRHST